MPKTRMGRPSLFPDKSARLSALRITPGTFALVERVATLAECSQTDALEALVRAAPAASTVVRKLRAGALSKARKP